MRARTTQVVAAAADLPAGISLSSKDVAMIDWPAEFPLAGSFSKTDAVVGRPLIHSQRAKEVILERDLGATGSGVGLTGRIPPGMRATAIRSNEIVGVAGFLYPGSHVDVLATYNPPGGGGPLTQTVLQDVVILTAGQTIEPDPQGRAQTVNVVTLLLNPEDSQKLLLASSQGSIQFVLRNGVDQKKVDIKPTHVDQLISTEKPPTLPTTPATGKPKRVIAPKGSEAPKPARVFVLEVIQGTQRNAQKFSE